MIYIIEDDENIRNLVQVALNGSGYETAAFETAEEALGAFKVKAPRLAIFDLMLPGMDGLEAIRKIRANDAWKKLPVLVLTAKDKEYDKVAGLDGGADDYMTKPFSVLELLARVRSLLRRTKEEEPEQPKLFDCGALHLDLETREDVKIDILGVVLTQVERTAAVNLVRQMFEENPEYASVLFKTGIRKGSAVPESTIAAVPVVRYAKKSNPSVDYMQLWNEIKQRLAKKEADE